MKTPKPMTEKIDARLTRPRPARVFLRRCETADPDAVQAIITETAREFGLRPEGRVFIKPNVVTANRAYIHHSYTDPRVAAAGVRWARENGAATVTIGESGGFGIPSRLFLNEAGYLALAEEGARVVDLNTEPVVTVPLRRGAHHKSMRVARALHDADFLMWMPKLKYHICCTITGALKLNVGTLRHEERMLFHDDRLDEKIVDLLEVGYPDLVVMDAIEIGTGYESAPYPVHMGVLVLAADPVAADVVACRMLGFDPETCVHLRLARERGYGPRHWAEIVVDGDVPLDEIRAKTAGHESEYQDIQKVKTPIRFYNGADPDRGRFCHGGCLAAVKGCLGTIDKRRPGSVAAAREGAIVTGVYDGDVDAGQGVALLIGDCTKVNGKITARKVKHVGGCPIGTKKLLVTIPWHFGLPSPMLDVRDAVLFVYYAIDRVLRRALAAFTPSRLP